MKETFERGFRILSDGTVFAITGKVFVAQTGQARVDAGFEREALTLFVFS